MGAVHALVRRPVAGSALAEEGRRGPARSGVGPERMPLIRRPNLFPVGPCVA
jgi:hypothetical protein